MDTELTALLGTGCLDNGNWLIIDRKLVNNQEVDRAFELIGSMGLEFESITTEAGQAMTWHFLVKLMEYSSRPGNRLQTVWIEFISYYKEQIGQIRAILVDMFVNPHNNVYSAYMGAIEFPILYNLGLIRGLTCMLSAKKIARIGRNSALRKLPAELIRYVSDFLAKDQRAYERELDEDAMDEEEMGNDGVVVWI